MKRILIGMILLLVAGAAAGAQDRVKTMSLQSADGSYKADYTFDYNSDGRLTSYALVTNIGGGTTESYRFRYDEAKDRIAIEGSDGVGSEYTCLPSCSVMGTHEPFACVALERVWNYHDGETEWEGSMTQYFYNDGFLQFCWSEEFTGNSTSSVTPEWHAEEPGLLYSLYGEDYDGTRWGCTAFEYDEEAANPFVGVDPVARLLPTGLATWWLGFAGRRPNLLIKGLSFFEQNWLEAEDEVEPTWKTVKFTYLKDVKGRISSITVIIDGEVSFRVKLTY